MKRDYANNILLSFQQRLRRLRAYTGLFFLMVFIPICIVFYFAFHQFEKKNLLDQQRTMERVTATLDKKYYKKLALSNALSFHAFDHRQYLYDPVTKKLTQSLSPLADLAHYDQNAALVGYFQFNAQNQFNSPIWSGSIDDAMAAERNRTAESAREKRAVKILQILQQSKQLKKHLHEGSFEGKERFQIIADVADYFIFYRTQKWNNATRIQGYILNRQAYFSQIFDEVLEQGLNDREMIVTLHHMQDKAETYYFPSHRVVVDAQEVTGFVPQQFLKDMRLISRRSLRWIEEGYSISYYRPASQMPIEVLYTVSLFIFLILCLLLGCFGFYTLGVRQLKFAEQRLNFVSSVSHELKTPLTSIRMYAEMLKSDMVLSEQHKNDYYDYIYSESGRLSRLITNILQLTNIQQPHYQLQVERVSVPTLMDIINSKVSTLLSENSFTYSISTELKDSDNVGLLVDLDAFSQVIINITDNAVKFFDLKMIKDSNRQKIDFVFSRHQTDPSMIQLCIRDYGAGISPEQEKRMFDLFYRGENELTRSTQGTGIGLALVHQLMQAQKGTVQAKRMKPGLTIIVSFRQG